MLSNTSYWSFSERVYCETTEDYQSLYPRLSEMRLDTTVNDLQETLLEFL